MAEQLNELGAMLGMLQQGFTPEQARARVDEARAMQFAQLSPSQQRTMMGFQAGQGLGRGVSSLFGVQQEDPTVRMATQLRATLSEQDMETSEGVLKAYRAVKDINPGVAEGLLKRYGELRKQEADIEATKALTAQRQRERQAADPKEQFARANADKFTPESLQAFMESGKFSDLKPITKETATTKPPADFLAVAVELGHGEKAKFGDYTAEQVRQINQTLLDRETGKRKAGAPKTEVVVPGMKEVKDVPDLRAKVLGTVAEARKGYEAADRAVTLADDAIKTSNFASAEGLASQLAKASGDTQLSNRDVQKYRTDPSFVGSVADVTKRLLTGTPTVDTLRKLREYARVLKAKQEESIKRELDTQRGLAKRSGFKDEDIDAAFGGIIGTPTGGNIRRTKSGVTYTVED